MSTKEAVDLLKENITVRQRNDEGFRRWFLNSYFELIVWYESKGGALYGFQLCVSRNNYERAFTWTRDYVSSHKVSESSSEKGFSNQSTGILKGDGNVISETELKKFENDSSNLEEDLRKLILEKIIEYNGRRIKEN